MRKLGRTPKEGGVEAGARGNDNKEVIHETWGRMYMMYNV